VFKASEADKISVFDAGHVGPLAKGLAQRALARAYGADHEGNLWQHGSAGVEPNLGSFLGTIDFTDLLKLAVHLDNGVRHFVIGFDAFGDDFFGVVGAATGLGAFEAAGDADFFRGVEVEDSLALSHGPLEFLSLLYSAGETVNEVVLKTVIRNDGYGVIIFKLRCLLWREWRSER